jgi:uncharacterized protein YhjY with autotransporter beta-barrel domain
MIASVSRGSRVRSLLLAGCAAATLGLAPSATAQQVGPYGPTGSVESPHEGAPVSSVETPHTPPIGSVETPHIVINNNFTPNDALDPNNITGVGQVITDSGGGFIGTCTGTLINPRTVLFAAHCVNTRDATAYGATSGGVAAGIGFETNTRANAPGQVDELVRWLLGSGANQAGRFQTNTAQAFYNISQIFYDPRSRAATSCTAPTSCFLEADVATAVLDTPARGIPTWALLFSPLPTPGSIDPATGTGYHVNITGYGSTGTGTTGSSTTGGFRRRAAENMLGALVSFDTRNSILFGSPGAVSRPQPLYFLDFDDPARGTPGANPRDFNGFRDNALTREGTTGPGDSGGPLILDRTFSKPVVIGVLSGGSTFFAGQPGGSYGTQSFYQPLFLYWDWIAANNPYRYVTAVAGNRNWEDGTAWVTELDPNYQIISNGQLVNGLPTHIGGGVSGNGPEFGEICFQSPSSSANPPANNCVNVATGEPRNNVPNQPADTAAPAVFNILGEDGLAMPIETAQATPGYTDTARPAPTIANGLPGATNFTPNNVDGVRTTGQIGRYYDVTLRNAGVITLNSAATIDRFAIQGATSQLTIASNGSLNSLMEIRQNTGTIVNNGTLATSGDYLILSGLLAGNGRVNAPFTTSVLGSIAPGTMGTIGTLTFNGDLILSSGSRLHIDLGANGASDRVVVNAGSGSAGAANIGGFVNFTPVSGFRIRDNQVFTFLTAQGGITGAFSPSAPFSAILSPRFLYSANAVRVEIEAGLYANVVDRSSPIQTAFAGLLDQNRSQYDRFADLYGELDLQNQATIRSQLEGFAPHAQNAGAMQGIVATDTTSRFIRNRMLGTGQANAGGTIAMYGKPVQLASLAASNLATNIQSDVGNGMAVQQGALPDSVAVYLAGGYIDGKGVGLPTATPTGRGDFDGYFIAAGIEAFPDDVSTLGFAMTYSDLDGNTVVPTQNASSQLVQGTLYGTAALGGLKLDAMVSAGVFEVDTSRQVAVGTTSFDLRATDRAFAFQSEVGIGFDAGTGGFALTPRASVRASRIEFTDTVESGGGPALQYELGTFDSLQGRVGATAKVTTGAFRPYVTANYVHEFEDRPAFFGANFRGGVGPQALIALPGTDRDWAEVSGGVAFGTDRISFAVEAETTIERKDVSNQAYKGTLTVRF